jgi:NADH:ubiquinone reductase (H+-translocating)
LVAESNSARQVIRTLPHPRVVIVGAGFGGLACARKLNGRAVDVLLIDERNFHLFTPLLYQVATALVTPSDISYPLRRVFRRSLNVRPFQARVTDVDFQRKVVTVGRHREISYDFLVLASGSTNNYFGNEQIAQHAIGLKFLEEATRLRNHVLSCLERADQETDPEERKALLTFLVVGGGPTGVEYSGALGELIHLVAGNDYPSIAPKEVRIILVEGRDRLLGMFAEKLGRYARRVLEKRNIEVITDTLVSSADERSATLSNGATVATRTIVWSAGVTPDHPDVEPSPPKSRSKRLEVDDRLRVAGAANAFAIGDVAGAAQNGEELPMLSAPAMQQGRYVAREIMRLVQTGEPAAEPFRYFDKGTMATIGRNAGVAQLRGGIMLTGILGWLAWIFVHIYYLIGFRNRLITMATWAWNYLRFDRPIRLILQSQPDPEVESNSDQSAAPGGSALDSGAARPSTNT